MEALTWFGRSQPPAAGAKRAPLRNQHRNFEQSASRTLLAPPTNASAWRHTTIKKLIPAARPSFSSTDHSRRVPHCYPRARQPLGSNAPRPHDRQRPPRSMASPTEPAFARSSPSRIMPINFSTTGPLRSATYCNAWPRPFLSLHSMPIAIAPTVPFIHLAPAPDRPGFRHRRAPPALRTNKSRHGRARRRHRPMCQRRLVECQQVDRGCGRQRPPPSRLTKTIRPHR